VADLLPRVYDDRWLEAEDAAQAAVDLMHEEGRELPYGGLLSLTR
jgi:hypothetical protein